MIDDLKRLTAIVQEGSATKAANKLFITQPALSHVIKRLEHDLGFAIFRREGKRLVLTQRGSEALLVIERIIQLWERMKISNTLLQRQSCTVGIYDNAALRLSHIFKKYYNNPLLDLEIVIDNTEKLFLQLGTSILDICVCIYDPQRILPSYVTLVATYQEKLIPVSSKQWEANMRDIPFILYNRVSVTRTYIDTVFTTQAVEPLVIAESTSPLFIKQLAMIGCGVALLPENFVQQELESKTLKQLTLPCSFERTVAIYANLPPNAPVSEALLKDMQKELVGNHF